MSGPTIKTRFLILSDTHGHTPSTASAEEELTSPSVDWLRATTGFRSPLPSADVVLHCGDLTTQTSPPEFAQTFNMLRGLDAPLKLVIAGNHDIALDEPARAAHGARIPVSFRDEALAMIEDAKQDGVHYLTEGTYSFTLTNGGVLSLYASPYTPQFGMWGFQYCQQHDFAIPPGVDVAMTHGPPEDILDAAGVYWPGGHVEHAGCPDLFRAIERSRPRLHCFGHIHESWGAYCAKWKPRSNDGDQKPATLEDCIDAGASEMSERLRDLKPQTRSNPNPTPQKVERLVELSKSKGYHIDYTDKNRGTFGEHTLFLNAAIQDMRGRPTQLPFIVDMLLHQEPPGGQA